MYTTGESVEIFCTMNRRDPEGNSAIELAWLPCVVVGESAQIGEHEMFTIEFAGGFSKTVSSNLLRASQ